MECEEEEEEEADTIWEKASWHSNIQDIWPASGFEPYHACKFNDIIVSGCWPGCFCFSCFSLSSDVCVAGGGAQLITRLAYIQIYTYTVDIGIYLYRFLAKSTLASILQYILVGSVLIYEQNLIFQTNRAYKCI